MQMHPPVGRHRLVWCTALLLLLTVTTATRAHEPDGQPLTFGILPFMSPIALLKRFAPLRDYLSQEIGHPVVLETARDYPGFVQRTSERRYDIVLTAPHFALQALDTGRYSVQATYLNELSAVILVRADSNIRSVQELAGKVIATPPPEAIVTMVGRRLLGTYLEHQTPPLYRNYLSHNAAFRAVAGGEASAAIVTVNVVQQAKAPEMGLVELTRSQGFPAMGVLVASDLTQDLQRRTAAVFTAMHDHPTGRAVLRRIGYPGYRPAAAEDFDSLRAYVPADGAPEPPAL